MRFVPILVLGACAVAGQSAAEPGLPSSRESRPVPLRDARIEIRMDKEGRLQTAEGPRAVGALRPEDKAALLQAGRREGRPSDLNRHFDLPENYDATPVLLHAPAAASEEVVVELVQYLASTSPYCVNLYVRTAEGCFPWPVLLPRKDGVYAWSFFCDGRPVGFDRDPHPDTPVAPHSITSVRLAPAGTDAFLVHLRGEGGLDLVPFEGQVQQPFRYELTTPQAAVRPGEHWDEPRPLEIEAERLSGTGKHYDEARREWLIEKPEELQDVDSFGRSRWRVVRGWEPLEHVAAAIASASRPTAHVNPILRYVRVHASPRRDLQHFVRVLEYAARHRMKGVFVELPARER